jgi:hypothetical protein
VNEAIVGAIALAGGYLLGAWRISARVFDVLEDWADARTGRAARWAAQPVYVLLIAAAFLTGPARFVRNVQARRVEQRRAPAVRIGPEWTGEEQS